MLMVWISSRTFGAFIPADARSQALGYAGTMLTNDATGFSNQAALALLEKPCFTVHAENPYFLPELAAGGFSVCVPLPGGTFALTYRGYGYEGYRESRTALAFGKKFGNRFRAGIEINYSRIRQYGDYGNLQAFTPAMGIQVLIKKVVTLGLQIENPAHQEFNPHGTRDIPVLVRAGVGYTPEPGILFCFEYRRETDCKPVYCGGIEYEYKKRLTFRVGVSSAARLQYAAGIGIRLPHCKTSVAVNHHPVLGYSSALTLTYSL
jgi:hypothetical protein